MRRVILTLLMASGIVSAASAKDMAHTSMGMGAEHSASTHAYMQSMETMHQRMAIHYTGDADTDFAAAMIPHHQGAVDMAKVELEYGKDPELRALAQKIMDAQKPEIDQMQAWLDKHGAKGHGVQH